jgi:glycosyltransferase involved in cell wall biosynthesis
MSGSSRPSITIVVPTRDRLATLGSTIDSCLAAADNATEVLVAESATGAHTGEVLKRFGDRIRVERAPTRLTMLRQRRSRCHLDLDVAEDAPTI